MGWLHFLFLTLQWHRNYFKFNDDNNALKFWPNQSYTNFHVWIISFQYWIFEYVHSVVILCGLAHWFVAILPLVAFTNMSHGLFFIFNQVLTPTLLYYIRTHTCRGWQLYKQLNCFPGNPWMGLFICIQFLFSLEICE